LRAGGLRRPVIGGRIAGCRTTSARDVGVGRAEGVHPFIRGQPQKAVQLVATSPLRRAPLSAALEAATSRSTLSAAIKITAAESTRALAASIEYAAATS